MPAGLPSAFSEMTSLLLDNLVDNGSIMSVLRPTTILEIERIIKII
jgi:hypothetical protein